METSRAAAPGEERPEHAEARPHLLDDLVGRLHGALGPATVSESVPSALRSTAEPSSWRRPSIVRMSRRSGTPSRRHLPFDEERGGEDGERCVLGPGNPDLALEGNASLDDDRVHPALP